MLYLVGHSFLVTKKIPSPQRLILPCHELFAKDIVKDLNYQITTGVSVSSGGCVGSSEAEDDDEGSKTTDCKKENK